MYKLESNSVNDCFKFESSCNSDLPIKQEPLSLTDAEMHAMAKDRQKKDNHNMSKYLINILFIFK